MDHEEIVSAVDLVYVRTFQAKHGIARIINDNAVNSALLGACKFII